MRRPDEPVELVVFLSYENEDPKALAEALVAELGEEPIAAGRHLLTGAAELRFFHDPARLARIQDWLQDRDAHYEIDFHQ